MQDDRLWAIPRFSRSAILAGLCAAISASPAAAQLRTVPTATGGTPPCEVAEAAGRSAAFPCGVIIFSPQGTVSSSELGSRARSAGANVRFEYRLISAAAARVPNRTALRALIAQDVMLIPDWRVNVIAKPSKGGGGGGSSSGQITPAGVQRIGAAPGQLGYTGSGVSVAIVDTGLDFSHADFKRADGISAISSDYFDAYGGNGQDQNGHGTHVGGIVAAQNNAQDVVGVAPGVTLHAVRVLDASGSGYDSDIIAGLDWIWDQNGGSSASGSLRISVANMSLGRAGTVNDDLALHTAVQNLTGTATNGQVQGGQGVTVVVAAGNDSRLEITQEIPAAYPEVLAIASATALTGNNSCNRLSNPIAVDTASYFTTDGAGVAVSAPGEDQENASRACMVSTVGILSLKLGGGTVRMSGTSMATPHVTGVAALLYQSGTTDPNGIRAKIHCGADRRGSAPLDSPTTSYSFDTVREGILSAPGAIGAATTCP